MDKRQIDVDELASEWMHQIREFGTYWNRMHEREPDLFPRRMSASEWEEEFWLWQKRKNKD